MEIKENVENVKNTASGTSGKKDQPLSSTRKSTPLKVYGTRSKRSIENPRLLQPIEENLLQEREIWRRTEVHKKQKKSTVSTVQSLQIISSSSGVTRSAEFGMKFTPLESGEKHISLSQYSGDSEETK
jgi:hypothetical protein